jgi:hypothetical protein
LEIANMRLVQRIATALIAAQSLGASYALAAAPQRVKTSSLNLVDPSPSWEYTIATERRDRPIARFTGPIGLDGLFKKSSTRYGIDAVKGAGPTTAPLWWSDESWGTAKRKNGLSLLTATKRTSSLKARTASTRNCMARRTNDRHSPIACPNERPAFGLP